MDVHIPELGGTEPGSSDAYALDLSTLEAFHPGGDGPGPSADRGQVWDGPVPPIPDEAPEDDDFSHWGLECDDLLVHLNFHSWAYMRLLQAGKKDQAKRQLKKIREVISVACSKRCPWVGCPPGEPGV